MDNVNQDRKPTHTCGSWMNDGQQWSWRNNGRTRLDCNEQWLWVDISDDEQWLARENKEEN